MYWLLIIIVLNIIGFFIWVLMLGETTEIDWFLPYQLHKHSEMNWFGSWFCSILFLILFPVVYLIQTLYWLFHI